MSNSLSEILIDILGPLLLLLLAPLFAGTLAKLRAMLESRQGPPFLQPYYDLRKLISKEVILPEASSWIFRLFPLLSLALMVLLVFIVPVFTTQSLFAQLADVILVFALLLLLAFLAVLAAMDAGNPFTGLGASREAFMMAMIEPTVLAVIMSLAVEFNSSNLFTIVEENIAARSFLSHPNMLLTALAFLVIVIVECKRFPIDNPNTHLELTMIHEALLLEYSGRYLAIFEYCSMLKITLLSSLFFSLFYPYGIDLHSGIYGFSISVLIWLVKMFAFAFVFALFEKSTAKLRVFRIPELISFALAMAVMSIFAHYFMRI